MKLRYRYRIYPTNQQKWLLAKLFGCCRVVWNDALSYCQQLYHIYHKGENKPSYPELSKTFLTQAKKTEEKMWLGEVSSICLQQSLKDLEQAYANFFNSCQGKRKGKKLNRLNLKRGNLDKQLNLPLTVLRSKTRKYI